MQDRLRRRALPPGRRRSARRKGESEQRDDMPTRKLHNCLYGADCPLLFFRAASNSSPGIQVTGGEDKACHPNKNPN